MCPAPCATTPRNERLGLTAARLRTRARAALALLAGGLALIAGPVLAQAQATVYRCGPEGREYSSTPCPAGKAVQVDDARSAEQRRQGQEAAQRDAALARQMTEERRQRAAEAKPGGATRIGPAPATKGKAKGKSKDDEADKKAHKKRSKVKKRKAEGDPDLSDPVRVPKAAR